MSPAERKLPNVIEVPRAVVDLKLPQVRELVSRLRFSPTEGRIWVDDQRAVLLNRETFAALREELISALGMEAARGMLTRIYYATGQRDAERARKKLGPHASMRDVLNAGGVMHALQGWVLPEHIGPGLITMDLRSEDYHGEGIWKESLEDEVHIAAHGIGSHAACWTGVGYCSGYLSVCAGRPILVREVECRAMGNADCRIVARPVARWIDAEDDLRYIAPMALPPVRVFGGAPGGDTDTHGTAVQRESAHCESAEVSERIIGTSAACVVLRHKIQRVAETRATVLLLGESGVGKSLIAREIHYRSQRSTQQFVEVNCAAIPEQLVESELFGVERGAFSGASASRVGRFEAAHGGTLFLDEIATLSMTAQGKLLRVLQSGEMERLGSNQTLRTDVRVIAATNEDLKIAVEQGRFRQDLYFRLNVFPIKVPPLRERRDDIPMLTELMIERFARQHGRRVRGIAARAMQALIHHGWPGNIRELENVIERGVIMVGDDELLDIHHLSSIEDALSSHGLLGLGKRGQLTADIKPFSAAAAPAPAPAASVEQVADRLLREGLARISDLEDALVRAAVQEAGGNVTRAAARLGLTRSQLDYKLKKAGPRGSPSS